MEEMEERKSHVELAKTCIENVAKQDEKDRGKTIRIAKYYSPIYEQLIAMELATMNDYLRRIAEALEDRK